MSENLRSNVVPCWHLSAFYFFYFVVLGILIPFLPLYLKDSGFDAREIGFLTAIMMATKIIAPYVWGWLADHYSRRMRVIRLGSFMAMLIFSGMFFANSFLWVAVVICGYSFFWNAVLAQFEVVTLGHIHQQPEIYSRIRLWGSIGFMLAVAGLGALFDVIEIKFMPAFVLLGLVLIWLSSLTVEENTGELAEHVSKTIEPMGKILKKPEVIGFFVVCFLMQLSHGPYYTFFSLYMEQQNYSRMQIGELWALGVLAEVILFWYMARLMPRWGLRVLILLSLASATIRWVLIALFPDNFAVIIFSQCLHAFTFGSFHAAAIESVRQLFSLKQAGRGQALYSSLSFGLGSALGALMSGYLWEWSHQNTFMIAGGVSFSALVIAWFWVKGFGEIGEVREMGLEP